MTSIRMVSNEEGERLRAEEENRQSLIKAKLIGCKVVNVIFSGCGITNLQINELVLENGDQRYSVTYEAEQYYECVIGRLVATDEVQGVELK
jgi:hypothetical protein